MMPYTRGWPRRCRRRGRLLPPTGCEDCPAMRISARTDYAIRVLVELAADTSRPLTCEGIASSQQIPYRFLKAVVRDLRQAGLVRSQRGCEGGYWLGRPAGSISLADVVAAVDGELPTVNGQTPEAQVYPAPAQRSGRLW